MAGKQFDVDASVELITTVPRGEAQDKACSDLLDYLSEYHPPGPEVVANTMLIVGDSGVDVIVEIISSMVPAEWRSNLTCKIVENLAAVVRILRESPPAVLLIHSNLFCLTGTQAIAALVAVSPGTRYLVITSAQPFIEQFQRLAERLPAVIHLKTAPFSRDELSEALRRLTSANSRGLVWS